jgi:hypothetical protein
MTETIRFPAPNTTSNRVGRRSPHAERRRDVRLVSQGVVASYLHDISQRHRDGVRGHSPRRDVAARADVLIAEGRQRDDVHRAGRVG